MADEIVNRFIGKTLTFPIEIDVNGRAVISEGVDVIRRSIETILSSPRGTRYFLNEFGSDLESVLEEPNDLVLEALVKKELIESITQWEKRIIPLDIRFLDATDTKINIYVSYQIRNTQVEDSFVFPFYRRIQQ